MDLNPMHKFASPSCLHWAWVCICVGVFQVAKLMMSCLESGQGIIIRILAAAASTDETEREIPQRKLNRSK